MNRKQLEDQMRDVLIPVAPHGWLIDRCCDLAELYAGQQNLQQTVCYTALELLEQMVKEETIAIPFSSDKFRVQEYHSNIDAIRFVMRLIKERQANAV